MGGETQEDLPRPVKVTDVRDERAFRAIIAGGTGGERRVVIPSNVKQSAFVMERQEPAGWMVVEWCDRRQAIRGEYR